MILFLEDWAKWPTAIPDTETKNRSWVVLASKYRAMGIENHAFLLALVNPALQGVDPHDPNLTQAQMAAIGVECRLNPWYFFRECARAPAMSGSDAVPLEANRGNIALFWCFFNHIFIILIQIRQTGKSFNVDILMNLLLNVLCKDTAINLMTKDDILRRKNIQRIKDIRDELPRYLQQQTRHDSNNTEEISVDRLGNTYTTHVPQSSPKRALNMGRGLTTAIFHIDEPPFQINISIALPAALSAMGAAVDAAKRVGAPYGTILTTTAGRKDDKDGAYVYNIVSDAAVWTEMFFDAENHKKLDRMVRGASRKRRFAVNATFNHTQLGKDDKWLREKVEEALAEGDDANRDFFNMWSSGSQTSPLLEWVRTKIAASHRIVAYTSISGTNSYVTRWYIPEEEIERRLANGKFILGMDTSEASGGDDISLVLVDVENLETLAVGTYNETNLITFSEWVCEWLVRFPNITAVIERRSTGAMLLDFLLRQLPMHGIDPFRRLFNTVVNDYEENPDHFNEIRLPMSRRNPDIYVRFKKSFGYATSASGKTSRKGLYGLALQNATKRASDRVYDKSLIDQILSLEYRNGRVDHPDGEHDDLVIGWLLVHWFLGFANKPEWYGLDPTKIMTNIAGKATETQEEIWIKEEQAVLRKRMEVLYDELSNEQDDFVSMRLEMELRKLDQQVILETDEIYSVDGLIRQAQERKRQKFAAKNRNVMGDQSWKPKPPTVNGVQVSYDRPLTAFDLRA